MKKKRVFMMEQFAKGSDGKVLWCWNCKENIKKGEKIYMIRDCSGRFVCRQCRRKRMSYQKLP